MVRSVGTASPGAAQPDDLASSATRRARQVAQGGHGRAPGPRNLSVAVAGSMACNPWRSGPHLCSLSFDMALEEIFPAWIVGAAVVFRPVEMVDAGPRFLSWSSTGSESSS